MRYRFGAVLALTTILLTISLTALAQEGGTVTVDGGFLQEGTHTLASEPTGELEGRTCDVTIDVTNNESVWPGNQLRVESGGVALVLNGVEDGAGAATHGTGQLTLGATIDVVLVVVEGSSLTAQISWTCPPVTTTTPPTTTTVPETTTLPVGANWSADNTCDTITVEFGTGIVAVDVHEMGEVDAFYTFTESGTVEAVVGSPTQFHLVPIADGDHTPVPASINVTVEPCDMSTTTVPTTPTTTPDSPPKPTELPFTGPEHIALGAVVASILVAGGFRLVRGRWGR